MFGSSGGPVNASALRSWLSRLGDPVDAGDVDSGELIDQIGLLERVKGACAARQARLSVAFDAAQRAAQRARVCPPTGSGAGWPSRSPSPGGSPRPTVAGISGWRRRW